MKNEKKAIPSHSSYYADRTGRIWTNRCGRWRLVKSTINGTGYQYTRLGNRQQHLTQRLVCAAFKAEHTKETPVCIRKAPRQQPRRVRQQRYINWGDRSQVKRKQWTSLTNDEKLDILTLHVIGHTQIEIAKMYGISQPAVSYVIRGKTKVHR